MADPKRGRYYTPAAQIREVPGLTKRPGCFNWTDDYIGSAETLVAAGLVLRGMLPGEPGNPISAVSYRPIGAAHDKGCAKVPGYLQIFRLPSGLFRAALVVSREEQERRKGARLGRTDAYTATAWWRAQPPAAGLVGAMSDMNTTSMRMAPAAAALLRELAKANDVTPRAHLESLLHYVGSCEKRPGSWEGSQPFDLNTYRRSDSVADRWFSRPFCKTTRHLRAQMGLPIQRNDPHP